MRHWQRKLNLLSFRDLFYNIRVDERQVKMPYLILRDSDVGCVVEGLPSQEVARVAHSSRAEVSPTSNKRPACL